MHVSPFPANKRGISFGSLEIVGPWLEIFNKSPGIGYRSWNLPISLFFRPCARVNSIEQLDLSISSRADFSHRIFNMLDRSGYNRISFICILCYAETRILESFVIRTRLVRKHFDLKQFIRKRDLSLQSLTMKSSCVTYYGTSPRCRDENAHWQLQNETPGKLPS